MNKIEKQVYGHGVAWEESFGYSQGLRCGDTLYISGQLAHDMEGKFIGIGDFTAQMRAAFENIDKVLAHFGASKNQIVNTTVLILNPVENFTLAAAAHREYFGDHRPASTTLGVVGLAFVEQLVEIAVTVRIDMQA